MGQREATRGGGEDVERKIGNSLSEEKNRGFYSKTSTSQQFTFTTTLNA